MKQKKFALKLIFLIFVSLFFFQVALNNRDKTSSSFSTPATLNTAQLTETMPIEINNNSDWTGLTGFSWFQGNGTADDPYIISSISISLSNESNCITISNSNVSFIIQNSKFSTVGYYTYGIDLSNCEKGIIYNNEFYSGPQLSGKFIYTNDCYNVSIINNNVHHAYMGFSLIDSDNLNVTGNLITDCYTGIHLGHCDNSYFSHNEIRLTENFPGDPNIGFGIELWYSDFNTIVENNFYCVPYCFAYEDTSTGNTIENNNCYRCEFYNQKETLDLELLISIIILIGELIATLVIQYRFPNRKRILGIILVGISLGVMGLLAHAVYNVIELIPNLFYSYRIMFLMVFYIPSLGGLFAGHLASILIGRKLIRKYGKKGLK